MSKNRFPSRQRGAHKKPKRRQSFLMLTDRARAANYDLTKPAILMHEHLLSIGGPYLTTISGLRPYPESFEESLGELSSKGFLIIIEGHLINPFYFIDVQYPDHNHYKYNPVPEELASKLSVSSDLKIQLGNTKGGSLKEFQEEIWENDSCYELDFFDIKREWVLRSKQGGEIEGRYREEIRGEETRRDKIRRDLSPILSKEPSEKIDVASQTPLQQEDEEVSKEEKIEVFLERWNSSRDDSAKRIALSFLLGEKFCSEEERSMYRLSLSSETDREIFDRLFPKRH